MKNRLVIANWKAYVKSAEDVRKYFSVFRKFLPAIMVKTEVHSSSNLKKTERQKKVSLPETVFCPSFAHLASVNAEARGLPVQIGAQDVFWEGSGAYTGEITVPVLKDIGATYVILGHSERRRIFAETDGIVNKKLKAVTDARLNGIVCVGEWEKAETDEGERQNLDFIKNQLTKTLEGMTQEQSKRLVVAYEPVWAISGNSGTADTPENAFRMITYIRRILAQIFDHATATSTRVIYGGSVASKNAGAFLSHEGIDGVLVGSASADPQEFLKIMSAAK